MHRHPLAWRFLLGINMVVNVGLILLLTLGSPAKLDPSSLNSHPPSSAPQAIAASPTSPDPKPSEPAPTQSPTNTIPFHWSQLESTDYPTYIANLRSVACPEPVIRTLIAEELRTLYVRPTPSPATDHQSFWLSGTALRERELTDRNSTLSADASMRAVYHTLLGGSLPDEHGNDWAEQAINALVLGFLPRENRSEVHAWMRELEEDAEHIRQTAQHILTPADREALIQLYEQRQGDLSRLLGPAQLEELALRMGALHDIMDDIDDLGSNVTADELRQLTKAHHRVAPLLWRHFADEHDLDDLLPNESKEPYASQLERDYLRILGPDRFATWKREQDPLFRQLRSRASKANIDEAAAIVAYRTFQDATQQLAELRTDASLDLQTRAMLVRQLATETSASLENSVGRATAKPLLDEITQWHHPANTHTP